MHQFNMPNQQNEPFQPKLPNYHQVALPAQKAQPKLLNIDLVKLNVYGEIEVGLLNI
jgi:hypothetical protein